jgi:protein phosphatase
MRAAAHGVSNISCVHTSSDDCVASWSLLGLDTGLAVLADSMTGFPGGGLASSLAVDTIIEVAQEQFSEFHYDNGHNVDTGTEIKRLERILRSAGLEANLNIRRAKADYPEYQDMATTVLAVAMNQQCAFIINAGNSRCYRINLQNDPAVCQLTTDDTIIQEMAERGIMPANEFASTLYRSTLTKALGPRAMVEFSTRSINVFPNDFLLLCSDGFYNAISQQEIVSCLCNDLSIQDKADLLMETSLQNQVTDNCCLVLMQGG